MEVNEMMITVIIDFVKKWTLPIAMVVGALTFPLMIKLSFLTPFLIFVMLLLTFCKISPRDLKLKPVHGWLLLIQIAGSLLFYFLVAPLDELVAQAGLICIICPTATAAAVITDKLGGNAASLTTYTLLINIVVAVYISVIFPFITANEDLSFLRSFYLIMSRVFPLLVAPFILAFLLEKYWKRLHRVLLSYHGLAFYLWAVSLAIVTAQTLYAIIYHPADGKTEILIAVVSLAVCGFQFFIGKQIGTLYNDRIASGQALGQKNTILAIWITQSYLNPLASIGPGAYVLWQNIINSWQLWKKEKRDNMVNLHN